MKYIKNLIGIAVVAVLALGIINFHKTEKLASLKSTIGSWFGIAKQKIDVSRHNLSFAFVPGRKRPLSFLSRESKLINFAENAFSQFSPAQWEDFWDLIYDPIEEEQDSMRVKRYLTQEEIQFHLKQNYPNPFSYFKKEHWDYFWNIVFGG